MHLIS